MSAESFRGYIAVPLEHYFNEYAREHNLTVSLTADEIEVGAFATGMVLLLCHKYKCDMPNEVAKLIENISMYMGKSYNQIPFSRAEEAFDVFKKYMDISE